MTDPTALCVCLAPQSEHLPSGCLGCSCTIFFPRKRQPGEPAWDPIDIVVCGDCKSVVDRKGTQVAEVFERLRFICPPCGRAREEHRRQIAALDLGAPRDPICGWCRRRHPRGVHEREHQAGERV